MPKTRQQRVLGVGLDCKGFGYVVAEGFGMLVDWGTCRVEDKEQKNDASLARLEELIDRYKPDAVVVEDCEAPGSRRRPRIRALQAEIEEVAESEGVGLELYSRREVRDTFSAYQARTRRERAKVLLGVFPELADRMPPERKFYHGQDPRMAIFDAAGLTALHLQETASTEEAV